MRGAHVHIERHQKQGCQFDLGIPFTVEVLDSLDSLDARLK